MSIRFCGMLKDFSSLEHGECPEGSQRLKEGESLDEILSASLRRNVPLMVLILALSIVRLHKGLNWEQGVTVWEVIFVGFLCILAYGGLVFIHEYMHILLFPRKAEKEIWVYDTQMAMVYCNAPMSRTRYVVMCLAPLTLLGFVPFIIWLLFGQYPSPAFSIGWMLLSWSMIFGGLGDFYNAGNILSQVPKKTLVFNYGMHTYWIPKDQWPKQEK